MGKPSTRMKKFWRGGELFVWMTASGVAISLLMVAGMLVLIMINGLGQFWPRALQQVTLNTQETVIGQLVSEETIPHSMTIESQTGQRRFRYRVGNRDQFGSEYRWINEAEIASMTFPEDLTFVERREWGPAYGRISLAAEGAAATPAGESALETTWETALRLVAQANQLRQRIEHLEREEIGSINYRIEKARLARQALVLKGGLDPAIAEADRRLVDEIVVLDREYRSKSEALEQLHKEASRDALLLTLSTGRSVRLSLDQIIAVSRPNAMNWLEKLEAYVRNLWLFVSSEPREANTEGGIFPAIFGTVLMVFLMTMAVMPFGVMAAVYLREYAKQGPLVRLVRIAVNNLAGVPSIVFGVFGLAFFVYALGGSIDQILFPEALPNPTFGTGGILWASLTLALLTVPVVIVATEEGLSAVPRDFREGSVGLGATKFETIRHVILPCALPGILTGLILAMARAAGEVAPLMLTGVVKLAPALPLDEYLPFLHLERKFMHLGFHIYDVGFQSPNVEAAKPMVYMTTLILILVVVLLNLTAVMLRNRLRKRFATSAV
ncbi:MAG: Phosphate transport system permease protein PstA [Nitrospira sp.]|nr:MAG: Phosphate transport system permease protein PstA [Nitrospira sp.]